MKRLAFYWVRFTLLVGGDILVCLSALGCALVLRRFGPVTWDFYAENALRFLLLFPVWIMVNFLVGLYDSRRLAKVVNSVGDSLLAFPTNLTLSLGFFYMFSEFLGLTPKTHLLLTLILSHAGFMLWRQVWVRLSANLPREKVIFWGSHPLIPSVVKDLRRHPYLGYEPVDSRGFQKRIEQLAASGNPLGGAMIERRVLRDSDLVVVDSEEVERDAALGSAVLGAAMEAHLPIVTLLDFYELVYRKVPPSGAARSSWLLSNVMADADSPYLEIKRLIDIALACVGLAASSPLLGLAFALIKLEDGGPVFYRQKRVGHRGREFFIWKVRTMILDAEASGPLFDPAGADRRVTSIGRWLRRFRIDEIPQFLNVLSGDMSIVGPRPEWVSEVRLIERQIPYYHLRHLVKPGITGWAQVNFRATNNPTDSMEKLHYDLYYVKNVSLPLDLGILLKTFKRIFEADTSFSPERETISTVGRPT